jgi:hypothetical protein
MSKIVQLSKNLTINQEYKKLFLLLNLIIIIITLLSLNIYKHVCDKYKQTRTNIMSYLCCNKIVESLKMKLILF